MSRAGFYNYGLFRHYLRMAVDGRWTAKEWRAAGRIPGDYLEVDLAESVVSFGSSIRTATTSTSWCRDRSVTSCWTLRFSYYRNSSLKMVQGISRLRRLTDEPFLALLNRLILITSLLTQ